MILKTIKYELMFRVKNIGRVPICNCRIDRAPNYKGYSFLLCWRCTSILTTFYAMKALIVLNVFSIEELKETLGYLLYMFSLALMLPTAYDGFRQYFLGKESTNIRRIITGLICGIGFYIFMYTFKYLL